MRSVKIILLNKYDEMMLLHTADEDSVEINNASLSLMKYLFCQNLAILVFVNFAVFILSPVLRSLHWLKINEYIEYRILSLAFKIILKTTCTT